MGKESNRKALKAGVWYTVCNFLVRAIGFISTPIFTRVLSVADVGNFSNMMSWVNLLGIVTTFDLYSSLTLARFDYKNEFKEYISSILVLSSCITFIFYCIFLGFKSILLPLLGFSELQLHIAFAYLFTYPALTLFQMQKQVTYEHKPIIIVSVLSSVLSTFGSLLMAVILSDKFYGRMMGYYIPNIIINLVLYIIIIKEGKKVSHKYWKYALAISAPLVFHLLAGYVLNSSDIIMIRNMRGSNETALYSISYSCAAIIQLLWSSMNSAWAPWSTEMMEKKDYNALSRAAKPFLLLFGFLVTCCILIAPEILLFMGGKAYVVAKYVIPPVMVGYMFQFIYSLYVNIEFFLKKQKYIASGTIFAALVNIVLNFCFIPQYGYIAAAYTTLVSYIVLFIVHFVLVMRLGKKGWYDDKFVLLSALTCIVIVVVSQLLYEITVLRYLIILAIGFCATIFMIINRKIICSAWKEKSFSLILDKFIK